MAGEALVMNLMVVRVNRNSCGGAGDASCQVAQVTVGRSDHASGVVGIGMIREISAMTSGTGPPAIVGASAAVRHGDCLAISRLQPTTGFMTG